MKTTRILAARLPVALFGVHPSGCQSRSNTLKRGQRTVALPAEPKSFILRTRLSALLSVAFFTAAGLLPLCPAFSAPGDLDLSFSPGAGKTKTRTTAK